MNAPFAARGHLRALEQPLTPEEVAERPALDDLLAAAFEPVCPVYDDAERMRAFRPSHDMNVRRIVLARRP